MFLDLSTFLIQSWISLSWLWMLMLNFSRNLWKRWVALVIVVCLLLILSLFDDFVIQLCIFFFYFLLMNLIFDLLLLCHFFLCLRYYILNFLIFNLDSLFLVLLFILFVDLFNLHDLLEDIISLFCWGMIRSLALGLSLPFRSSHNFSLMIS